MSGDACMRTDNNACFAFASFLRTRLCCLPRWRAKSLDLSEDAQLESDRFSQGHAQVATATHSARIAICASQKIANESVDLDPGELRWGLWETNTRCNNDHPCDAQKGERSFIVRLCLGGFETRGKFATREAALEFQREQLLLCLGWPRTPIISQPQRSPIWDHPEELEEQKEYTFRGVMLPNGRRKTLALSNEQFRQFDENGFLLGVPVLEPEELQIALNEFDDLLASRIDRAPSDEARFRSAHTLSRPLHQKVVARLARHPKVIGIVEDILGPSFVCWSAHLFCKLPGDPTEQPWHQDAGFWPLSQSRALTLWLAFDDVDASNAGVTFVKGSHRLGRLGWQPTDTEHHLLTQQIPDVDLLGPIVQQNLRAGEASIHSDLTVHSSGPNRSNKRRAGLALRFVGTDAWCLGPMINGYSMNAACIHSKGPGSDPSGHWQTLRRRPGGKRAGPRHKEVNECTISMA